MPKQAAFRTLAVHRDNGDSERIRLLGGPTDVKGWLEAQTILRPVGDLWMSDGRADEPRYVGTVYQSTAGENAISTETDFGDEARFRLEDY